MAHPVAACGMPVSNECVRHGCVHTGEKIVQYASWGYLDVNELLIDDIYIPVDIVIRLVANELVSHQAIAAYLEHKRHFLE